MTEPLIWFLGHLAGTGQDRATSNNLQLEEKRGEGEGEEERGENGKERGEQRTRERGKWRKQINLVRS